MSTKKGDVFSEMIVGVFMIAVLALLIYFTVIISGVDLVAGREKTDVRIEFRDVGGLKERDNVIYRGMKVGSVESITLSTNGIVVVAHVDDSVVLREGCRISVAALSLLGGNYLLLEEGKGEPQPIGTTTFAGEAPTDWMKDLGEIARKLNDIAGSGSLKSIVTNFESTAEKLNTIVSRVERGEGTVGKFLSTNDAVYADIAATAASAKTIAGRLEQGEGTIGKLLSTNDTVYADLKNTLARASSIADRLERGEGTIGKLLSSDDAVYNDIRATVADIRTVAGRLSAGEGLLGRLTKENRIADDAEKLIANLNDVADRLAKGKGTLGRLTTDEALYNEISGLIKDVRQIVDNYRDTTPISTFAGLIGGAL